MNIIQATEKKQKNLKKQNIKMAQIQTYPRKSTYDGNDLFFSSR